MPARNNHNGRDGERRAEAWLTARGLELVERNYRCRSGEIDLVMRDQSDESAEILAFVEVRLRGAGALVEGIDSIDRHKQQRLVRAARHFLMTRPEFSNHVCRFDVIGIDGEAGELKWIPDAFELASD